PFLKNPLYAVIYSSSVLWIFTLINVVGVKKAGKIQAFATVFKIAFFAVFIIVAFFSFDSANLMPLLPEGKGLSTIPLAATATLWAFVGLESATVTAGEIKDPERNVKKSTIYGLLIAAVIYIIISIVSMGAMSNADLAASQAPLTDILTNILGSSVGRILSIAIVVSILGTVIGWLLSTARISYAAGEDGVFPKFFATINTKYGTPVNSLVISAVLVNILLVMNYQKSMVSSFTFITILATLSFLPVYLLTAAAEMMLMFKDSEEFTLWIFIKKSIVPLLAFVYTIWTIYGSGAEIAMWGFILMLLGIPFYIYNFHKNKKNI
ncbi:MAG: APC family permease, partial [Clostridium sp.]